MIITDHSTGQTRIITTMSAEDTRQEIEELFATMDNEDLADHLRYEYQLPGVKNLEAHVRDLCEAAGIEDTASVMWHPETATAVVREHAARLNIIENV